MELTWIFALFASCLEKHADDGHHGKSAVRQLGRQFLSLLSRIRGGQHLEAIVAGSAGLVVIEATAEFHEAKVRGNLRPAGHWHLGDSGKAIWDVSELQSSRWRQKSRPQNKKGLQACASAS